jgi:CcmD family protein
MDLINLRFLFYGYTAAWLIVIAFILMLVRRGSRIEREITRLRALLEHREPLAPNRAAFGQEQRREHAR